MIEKQLCVIVLKDHLKVEIHNIKAVDLVFWYFFRLFSIPHYPKVGTTNTMLILNHCTPPWPNCGIGWTPPQIKILPSIFCGNDIKIEKDTYHNMKTVTSILNRVVGTHNVKYRAGYGSSVQINTHVVSRWVI